MLSIIHRVVATVIVIAVLIAVPNTVLAQPQKRMSLPQEHEYQKVLHQFMATITEKDVTHGVPGMMVEKPSSQDPDYLYRNYIYALMHQPMVGTKRGYCAVNSAPACYTLALIEQPDGVRIPPTWPEALISMMQWDYPGNPYQNNRALKLRAFVAAATYFMMFHDHAERNDSKNPPPVRPDWHGYNPVWFALPYPGFKDALPPEVQKAYETGLKMMGERMLKWGIRGESCENDYNSTVGLLCIARAINDADFSKRVEAFARPLFTDPKHFSPAGYWTERGGIETGFGGTANWFVAWTALMTDWPFAKDALGKVYRLRGHLYLPEPDGSATGPSHFNSRLGSPVTNDQWAWNDFGRGSARDYAASLVTDEAAYTVKTLKPEELASGTKERVAEFNFHLGENSRVEGMHYLTNAEMLERKLMPGLWEPRIWMSYDFPASVNPGYEFYPKGARARREQLEKANSPLLQPPMLRGENFVRAFEKDFVIARQPGFAAILHTGPVGAQNASETKFQFAGPLGLGGGQLSAFWTPQTGSVILGLRVGMSYNSSFDKLPEWRTWPNHSVSGVTASGKIFTSARNAKPEVMIELNGNTSTTTARGPLVAMQIIKDPAETDATKARDQMYDMPLEGKCEYARTFKTDEKGVSVETKVTGDGKESISELYEVLPIYMGKTVGEKKAIPTEIKFQVNGAWQNATENYTEKVSAVKLVRFDGAVLVTFLQPRRIKLSPTEWKDAWLNAGSDARNVMIDLLESGDKAIALQGEKKISYRIEPTSK